MYSIQVAMQLAHYARFYQEKNSLDGGVLLDKYRPSFQVLEVVFHGCSPSWGNIVGLMAKH